MKKITGSEAIMEVLVKEGVKTIFGYPGGAIMPIYDALHGYSNKITHILSRHEQGAIHAAQGFSRVSGKVGVCLATSGPGATNLITGLADAQIDSTALVCITGQVPSHLLGTDAFQESDVIGRPVLAKLSSEKYQKDGEERTAWKVFTVIEWNDGQVKSKDEIENDLPF